MVCEDVDIDGCIANESVINFANKFVVLEMSLVHLSLKEKGNNCFVCVLFSL